MAKQNKQRAPKTTKQSRKSATGAVVKHKVTSPAVKFVDFRAASSERVAIARAMVTEKVSHLLASLRVTLVNLRHPVHPVRKVAAKEAARETKSAATERRNQAVAQARTKASHKRAYVRERRARELNRSVM